MITQILMTSLFVSLGTLSLTFFIREIMFQSGIKDVIYSTTFLANFCLNTICLIYVFNSEIKSTEIALMTFTITATLLSFFVKIFISIYSERKTSLKGIKTK